MLRKYESIIVFNPSLSEAAVKDEAKKYEKLVETNGAKSIKVENWGRKQIAYLVRKQSFGTFVVLQYETENTAIPAILTAQLRISDSVIKYQSHRLSDRVRKFQGNPKRKPSLGGEDSFGDSIGGEF